LAAAELAFVGLTVIFVIETWTANGSKAPDLSAVQDALNEAETPSILKTIAVAFAGYVVAFVSTAYQQLSED
jgi:hypothetical protein